MTTMLLLAFLIGVVSGLRSMTAPAVVCWAAHLGWIHLDGSPLAFLHTTIALILFTIFALGELVADKLPFVPARTKPGPLVARILLGGLSGAALAVSAGGSLVAGAVVGAIGAVAGTFGGYQARHALVTRSGAPDLVIALLEDVVAVGGGLLIVSRF
jgi:uncharacterized membrane protein